MLKPLWYLVKITLLVLLITWLAARPGDVEINWNGYLIETSFGFMLAVVLTLIVLCSLLYRAYRSMVRMPQVVRQYRKSQAREKGYEAVTKGLVAVAAGDAKGADKQARRAGKLIPGAPLTGLLSAQAALMNGDNSRAHLEFETLLEDKNAAFFGLRGLLNEAFRENDQSQALLFLRTAENLHPRRTWIVRSLFEAECQAREWIAADQTLTKAIRLNIYDRERGNEYRQAILTARAQKALDTNMEPQALSLAKKAFRLDAGFVPASVLYAKLLVKNGKNRAAIKVIEQAWAAQPHPDLDVLWAHLAPSPKGKTEEDKKKNHMNWFRRLYNLASYRPESNELMGKAAMDLKMYEDARNWLKSAGNYRLLARLEQLDGRHEVESREWLEMAATAKPGPAWVCETCGHQPMEWDPLCPSCHDFDSIDWRRPDHGVKRVRSEGHFHARDTGFIEPPESL
tara:strand:+ start:136 stop:1500 length:1365 start_codon:yes stop_codon:yes gene_type:complete